MAKVLIDIPNENYAGYKELKEEYGSILSTSEESIANGIVLDGLTNGEALKQAFPYIEVVEDDWKNLVWVRITEDNSVLIHKTWWNRKWGE